MEIYEVRLTQGYNTKEHGKGETVRTTMFKTRERANERGEMHIEEYIKRVLHDHTTKQENRHIFGNNEEGELTNVDITSKKVW